LERIAENYPDDEQLQRIVEVWRAYHLNDLKPGLPEQERAIALWKRGGWKYDYKEACDKLAFAGLLVVYIPPGAKALGGFENEEQLKWDKFGQCWRTIPTSMGIKTEKGVYRYGTRWIYSEIPADVLEEIKSWADLPTRQPLHLDAAQAFLDSHNMKMRATHKGDKCPPWCDGSCVHGDRYRITISRKGAGRLSFDFWNSQHDRDEGNEPTAYDVFASISGDAYCPDAFEEFCSEYDHDTDSRQALQLFRRVSKFAKRLQLFFEEEELEQLAEIR
jgi:hypothetical protein